MQFLKKCLILLSVKHLRFYTFAKMFDVKLLLIIIIFTMENEKSDDSKGCLIFFGFVMWLVSAIALLIGNREVVDMIQSVYRLELAFWCIIGACLLFFLIKEGLDILGDKLTEQKYSVTSVVIWCVYIGLILYFTKRLVWDGSIF